MSDITARSIHLVRYKNNYKTASLQTVIAYKIGISRQNFQFLAQPVWKRLR